ETYLNFYKFKLDKITKKLFDYKYRFAKQKFLYANKLRIININFFNNNVYKKRFNYSINSFIKYKFYYLKHFKFSNFINTNNKYKILNNFINEKMVKNYPIKIDNIKNILDFDYNKSSKTYENNKMNFLFKKAILNSLFKKLRVLRRYNSIYRTNSYKIIKSNLKKYNFFFNLINNKNTMLPFYYLKQLYKSRRFVLLTKNRISI